MWHDYIQWVAWAGLEHLLTDPDDIEEFHWVWDKVIDQYHAACNFVWSDPGRD